MIKQPEYLHIPTLYEGEPTQIGWGVGGAEADYIVERVFNESFSQALAGQSWDNIDTINESWSRYDQDALPWYQIEGRTGIGQTWERLDYEQLSWPQIEGRSQTWQQLEKKEISFEIFRGQGVEKNGIEQGRTWLELDGQYASWSGLEAAQHSWHEGEKITLPGLPWDGIEARWMTFGEWEQKGLTFHELDTQAGAKRNQELTDFIPIGAKNASYRIKARHADGRESGFLSADQMSIIPIFYRSSEMMYPVSAGKRYRIFINAQDIRGLDRVRMNLRYDPYLLELTDFAAHHPGKGLKLGHYPAEQLILHSHVPGKVWFQSTKTLGPDECFSGMITLMEFTAKKSGWTAISLS